MHIWAWVVGYLIIKIKGADIELLLNKIADRGLGLWDIDRVTTNIIVGKIPIRQFKLMRPLLGGLNIQVSIVGKCGLPFLVSKLFQRKMLIVGLLITISTMYYLSGFIWFIEITGNKTNTTEQILLVAANAGFDIGLSKSDLDFAELENIILTKFPHVSWAAADIKGVVLNIQVVERTSPELEEVQYGDLIAGQDGLVTQVLPFHGTVNVYNGDTVRKGDLLISGDYFDHYGKLQKGSAEGIVRARVWYDAIGEAAYSKVAINETGRYHTNYSVTFGNKTFRLGQKVPFETYVVESDEYRPQIKAYSAPVAWVKHSYSEVYYETIQVPHQLARSLALERAWQQLEEAGVDCEKILDSQIEEYVVEDQHGIRIGLIVECEENIAQYAPKF